jgi:nucleoside-diphosphate-sugar epimerase
MINRVLLEDLDYILSDNLDWNKFSNCTVLITGANGFLPAYMLETLLHLNTRFSANVRVIALVRNKDKALKKFEHHKNRTDLEFLVQDVCTPVSIAADRKIDYIIHAASQASPKFYGKDPIGTINANTIGTSNMLYLAKEKDVKSFLFFSSGEVYGNVSEDQIPTKETDFAYLDPTNIRSCYGESKRMGECICISWFHQYGTPVKIIRPFHTYGPGMDLEDGRVFADFVSDVVRNKDIVMHSDGRDTRAFCYLADATLGFFRVLLRGENGVAYNVGSDYETSIEQLANTLVSLFPEKRLKVIQNKSVRSNEYINSTIRRGCPDITRIKLLDWSPKFSIENGFKRTIKSYYEKA